MPVRMDDHLDEVRIVEGARRALERRLVESPRRRPHAPQEARDPAPVLGQAAPSALTVEIILVPERRLLGRRRRLHRARDVLDVVRIARDERLGALRPKRRDDARRPPAPIVAAEHGALDMERVHQRLEVRAKGRLLARTRRLGREEPRRPVAAQIGNDDPRPGLSQDRGGLGIGVDVVREAVPQDAGPAGRRAIFQIGDGKNAGVDRLDGCRHGSLALLSRGPSSGGRPVGRFSRGARGQRPRQNGRRT